MFVVILYQIFKTNEFFCGLSIPDPGMVDPIERKLHKEVVGSEGIDFMKRCLDKDPGRRWTCEQLLGHAFFKTRSFKVPNYEEEYRRVSRAINEHVINWLHYGAYNKLLFHKKHYFSFDVVDTYIKPQ